MAIQLQACAQIIGADANPPLLPEVCQGTLYVRVESDFSGTATDIAVPHFWGLYDHLRYLNEHGGILGCQIDIATVDNHYDGPTTTTVTQALRTADPNWSKVNTLFIFGTAPTTAVAASLAAEGKIVIPGSYAGSLATPGPIDKTVQISSLSANDFTESTVGTLKQSGGYPYVFFPCTDYGTSIRLAIEAAAAIAPGRMGMAYDGIQTDACSYCSNPIAAGESYVDNVLGMRIGVELKGIKQTSDIGDYDGTSVTDVAGNPIPSILSATRTYFAAEIAEVIKTNGSYEPVTWLWAGNSVGGSSMLGEAVWDVQTNMIDDQSNTQLQAAVAHSTWGPWKIRVMANNWGIGETTATQFCRGGACTHDNFYGLFPVPHYGDIQTSAAMGDIIAQHDEFSTKDVTTPPPVPRLVSTVYPPTRDISLFRDVRYVQGYAAALLWEKGITAAIQAGHRTPTGTDLKNAFETFTNVSMNGATASTITFTPTDHRPQHAQNIYRINASGNLEYVNNYSISLALDWLGY